MAVWALLLTEPDRGLEAATVPLEVPSLVTPPTVDVPGVLADGATYAPRLYLDPETSVGVATGEDGTVRVILARAAGSFTQLRHLSPEENAQVNGFAVDGDTLVWMESTTRPGAVPATTLWRTSWRTDTPAVQVSADTGAPTFGGFATDVVLSGGLVSWTALAPDGSGTTHLRSVPVTGGVVSVRPLDGQYRLTTPPWAVTAATGPGQHVTFVNLETGEQRTTAVAGTEAVVCDRMWCRIAVSDDTGLVGIDMMRPDGSERRRIAGPEATPVIGDPTLLDRYVPLAVDRGDGVGLALHDLVTEQTRVIAAQATNVAGRGGVLWWSSGAGATLTWHALDLTGLS